MTNKEFELVKANFKAISLYCNDIKDNHHEVYEIQSICNSFLKFLEVYCKTITDTNLENTQLDNLTNTEAFKFGAEVMLDKVLDFLNFNIIGITTLNRESRSEFIERLSKEM